MSAAEGILGIVVLALSGIGLYQTYRWVAPKPDKLVYEHCKDKAVFETPNGKQEIRYMSDGVRKTIEQAILEREAQGTPLSAYELYQLHKRLDANADNVITPEEARLP